jgi:hypothetical protein
MDPFGATPAELVLAVFRFFVAVGCNTKRTDGDFFPLAVLTATCRRWRALYCGNALALWDGAGADLCVSWMERFAGWTLPDAEAIGGRSPRLRWRGPAETLALALVRGARERDVDCLQLADEFERPSAFARALTPALRTREEWVLRLLLDEAWHVHGYAVLAIAALGPVDAGAPEPEAHREMATLLQAQYDFPREAAWRLLAALMHPTQATLDSGRWHLGLFEDARVRHTDGAAALNWTAEFAPVHTWPVRFMMSFVDPLWLERPTETVVKVLDAPTALVPDDTRLALLVRLHDLDPNVRDVWIPSLVTPALRMAVFKSAKRLRPDAPALQISGPGVAGGMYAGRRALFWARTLKNPSAEGEALRAMVIERYDVPAPAPPGAVQS